MLKSYFKSSRYLFNEICFIVKVDFIEFISVKIFKINLKWIIVKIRWILKQITCSKKVWIVALYIFSNPQIHHYYRTPQGDCKKEAFLRYILHKNELFLTFHVRGLNIFWYTSFDMFLQLNPFFFFTNSFSASTAYQTLITHIVKKYSIRKKKKERKNNI